MSPFDSSGSLATWIELRLSVCQSVCLCVFVLLHVCVRLFDCSSVCVSDAMLTSACRHIGHLMPSGQQMTSVGQQNANGHRIKGPDDQVPTNSSSSNSRRKRRMRTDQRKKEEEEMEREDKEDKERQKEKKRRYISKSRLDSM